MKLICIFYTICGELWFHDPLMRYLRKKTTFEQHMPMRKIFPFLAIIFIFISCGKKVKDINQDEDVVVSDFIQSFKEIELPIQFKAESFDKKESDSDYIKPTVVSKFVPDSIFKNELGKLKDIKFYRKGRFKAEETEETYLFLTAQKKEKRLAYILCLSLIHI